MRDGLIGYMDTPAQGNARPEGVAWAHLDIAGPAENPEEPYGCVPKGGTGVAVRTLVALAAQLA